MLLMKTIFGLADIKRKFNRTVVHRQIKSYESDGARRGRGGDRPPRLGGAQPDGTSGAEGGPAPLAELRSQLPITIKNKVDGAVVAIGVFDGLHRGHCYLIKQAVSWARRLKLKSLCLTFHPHPSTQPYLISLKHRLKLIAELGVDYCLVIPFNKKFSAIPAEDFIRSILVRFFHPALIFVGKNFHFGYQARGDVQLLRQGGKDFGFRVMAVKELSVGTKIISSGKIRRLISRGSLQEAEKLLGRKVSVLGTVIEGSKRGRILGYPTANIDPHHEVLPKEGVYAVEILYDQKEYGGLCNIGQRPTFNPEFAIENGIRRQIRAHLRHKKLLTYSRVCSHFFLPNLHSSLPSRCCVSIAKSGFKGQDEAKTIEVHLFGFKRNIYGQDLEIQFIRKIRKEKKFPSAASLSNQIKNDCQKALRILRIFQKNT